MNRVAIITVAGVSSRFNKGIDEKDKVLKCLYSEGDETATLLYRMLQKLSYADRIIIVGGYKFEELKHYVDRSILENLRKKIGLVFNDHFEDLASGYSLYLGLNAAFEECGDIKDILFVEGDLDIDRTSLEKVIDSGSSVLTFNHEPIDAAKAVVLYADGEGHYKYAFNASHGLLHITEPFGAIYNSGQTWKFTDMEALRAANERFGKETPGGTNLVIIGDYISKIPSDEIEILPLKRWTNCNTRDDYRHIRGTWDDENT